MTATQGTTEADAVVIGGGIAGASLGYFLAPHARVVLLERESQPGYHSTGRSAALFMESYGTAQVRALTRASRAFLEQPPEGFVDGPILSPRGAMLVAAPGQAESLDDQWAVFQATSPYGRLLDAAAACALVPALRRERVLGAVFEPDASDIDVARLHQGYLRGIRRSRGRVVTDAEVTSLRRQGDTWLAEAGAQRYAAPGRRRRCRGLVRRRRPTCRSRADRLDAEAPQRLRLRAAGGRRRFDLADVRRHRRELVCQA